METNGNSVINALKRLERAGSETSRTSAKLIAAAGMAGERVASVVLAAVAAERAELPRGYAALSQFGWLPEGPRLAFRRYPPNGGDYYLVVVTEDRSAACAFAADIASGLLDELAAWLEARQGEDETAIATLERAAAAMQGTPAESEQAHAERNLRELGQCPLCGSEEIELRWNDAADLPGYCRACAEYFEITAEEVQP